MKNECSFGKLRFWKVELVVNKSRFFPAALNDDHITGRWHQSNIHLANWTSFGLLVKATIIVIYHILTGDLMAAIVSDFGSFENFKARMTAATVAVQGSGWGWLVSSCILFKRTLSISALKSSISQYLHVIFVKWRWAPLNLPLFGKTYWTFLTLRAGLHPQNQIFVCQCQNVQISTPRLYKFNFTTLYRMMKNFKILDMLQGKIGFSNS